MKKDIETIFESIIIALLMIGTVSASELIEFKATRQSSWTEDAIGEYGGNIGEIFVDTFEVERVETLPNGMTGYVSIGWMQTRKTQNWVGKVIDDKLIYFSDDLYEGEPGDAIAAWTGLKEYKMEWDYQDELFHNIPTYKKLVLNIPETPPQGE